MAILAGGRDEWIIAPVVVADPGAEVGIALSAAEVLDPRVFVRRHALGGGLPADPVRLLREDDGAAHAGGGQGCGDAAEAAADDEHIAGELAGGFRAGFVI